MGETSRQHDVLASDIRWDQQMLQVAHQEKNGAGQLKSILNRINDNHKSIRTL